MKNFSVIDIENQTINNTNYRKVLMTSSNMQLVVMSLNLEESIDLEIHDESDQFFRIEKGICKIEIYEKNTDVYPKQTFKLKENDVVIIPKKTYHKITNIGNEILKLYTIYSPPHHNPNKINPTKQSEQMEKYKYKILKYSQKIKLLENNNLT